MDSLQKTSHLTESSRSLLRGNPVQVNVFNAWFDGSNVRAALKVEPELTRAYIVKEVASLCKMVDAKKTLSSDEEISFCCRAIIDEHPTLKIEELHVIFNMIKKGKLIEVYERLKTAEILKAICIYESEYRAPAIEKQLHQAKQTTMPDRKLEPLNLAKLVEDSPLPTPEGLGTRLRKKNGWQKTHEDEAQG